MLVVPSIKGSWRVECERLVERRSGQMPAGGRIGLGRCVFDIQVKNVNLKAWNLLANIPSFLFITELQSRRTFNARLKTSNEEPSKETPLYLLAPSDSLRVDGPHGQSGLCTFGHPQGWWIPRAVQYIFIVEMFVASGVMGHWGRDSSPNFGKATPSTVDDRLFLWFLNPCPRSSLHCCNIQAVSWQRSAPSLFIALFTDQSVWFLSVCCSPYPHFDSCFFSLLSPFYFGPRRVLQDR